MWLCSFSSLIKACRRMAFSARFALPFAMLGSPAWADGTPDIGASSETVTPLMVQNPYGLEALWGQGDFVARGTLLILVIMSAATWYILITKLVEQTKLLRQATSARKLIGDHESLGALMTNLPKQGAFRFLATTGQKAVIHHQNALIGKVDLHTWTTLSLQRAVEEILSSLNDRLAVLATVGSTAPFVGLFGTVWGIYHALTAIGIAGQASIDKVAGPVGEALIMTAIGLAVAVPAVLGYNLLVRRNKAVSTLTRSFVATLHGRLLSQGAA